MSLLSSMFIRTPRYWLNGPYGKKRLFLENDPPPRWGDAVVRDSRRARSTRLGSQHHSGGLRSVQGPWSSFQSSRRRIFEPTNDLLPMFVQGPQAFL
jgi:hypothetical protein